MSTDFDKAHAALRLLRDECSVVIDALREPPNIPLSQTSLASHPTCAVLYKDFLSLLTLIYTSTTKITLVLRPSTAVPSAALAPLSDLTTAITSFATCAALFQLHGRTIGSEAGLFARDVCEAVRALTVSFIDNAGSDYLVRAGAVHDLGEKARRELPSNNLAAVKKRWVADMGIIEDCVREINELVDSEWMEVDDDDIGDEWDVLGIRNVKLPPPELHRVKIIQPSVRLVMLFHKRVVPDILGNKVLSSSTGADTATQNAALDALLPLSNALLLALEKVVANSYAPQDPDHLDAAMKALAGAVRKVHEAITIDILVPPSQLRADLSRDMSALRIDGGNPGESGEKEMQKDVRRWFGRCLAQIDDFS